MTEPMTPPPDQTEPLPAAGAAAQTPSDLERDVASIQRWTALLMLIAGLVSVPMVVLALLPLGWLGSLELSDEATVVLKDAAPFAAAALTAVAIIAERLYRRASHARRLVQVPSGR